MRILPLLALGIATLTGGCYDPYGRIDPGRTALLGAGVGAAAGLGVAAASQPRYYAPGYDQSYYAPQPRYYAPQPRYYAPQPRYYAPAPNYYYGQPRYYGY